MRMRACDFKGRRREEVCGGGREKKNWSAKGEEKRKNRRERERERERRTWNISRCEMKEEEERVACDDKEKRKNRELHCKRGVLRGHVFRALLPRTADWTTKSLRRLSLSRGSLRYFRRRCSLVPPCNTDAISSIRRKSGQVQSQSRVQGFNLSLDQATECLRIGGTAEWETKELSWKDNENEFEHLSIILLNWSAMKMHGSFRFEVIRLEKDRLFGEFFLRKPRYILVCSFRTRIYSYLKSSYNFFLNEINEKSWELCSL